MQLACMARESEKPLAPKTSNLKCEDGKVFLKDGTCGSAFAQFLANSLKSFNDNMSKVSTSSSTTTQTLTKTLIIGTKGDQVKILQNKLKVESTGYFGSLTRSAVIKFQKDNNITQTGTVGPATRQALNKL
jgi:peptidoglycan hydrolase-like protein with peptidoglycan-binding domain